MPEGFAAASSGQIFEFGNRNAEVGILLRRIGADMEKKVELIVICYLLLVNGFGRFTETRFLILPEFDPGCFPFCKQLPLN